MTRESGAGRNQSCLRGRRGCRGAGIGAIDGGIAGGSRGVAGGASAWEAVDWIATATGWGKHTPFRCPVMFIPRLRLPLSCRPTIEGCEVAHRRNGPLICHSPCFVNPNPPRIRSSYPTRPALSGAGVWGFNRTGCYHSQRLGTGRRGTWIAYSTLARVDSDRGGAGGDGRLTVRTICTSSRL